MGISPLLIKMSVSSLVVKHYGGEDHRLEVSAVLISCKMGPKVLSGELGHNYCEGSEGTFGS